MSFLGSSQDKKKPSAADISRAERAARKLKHLLEEKRHKEEHALYILGRFVRKVVGKRRALHLLRQDWDEVAEALAHDVTVLSGELAASSTPCASDSGTKGGDANKAKSVLVRPKPPQLLLLAGLLVRFYSPAMDHERLACLSQWMLPHLLHTPPVFHQALSLDSADRSAVATSTLCRLLWIALERVCGPAVSIIDDLGDPRLYLTGPEMRLLLLYMDPKQNRQHSDVVEKVHLYFTRRWVFRTIHPAIRARLLPLANTPIHITHLNGGTKESRQVQLWVNAILQISMHICGASSGNSHSEVLLEYIKYIATCPLIAGIVNDQAIMILLHGQFLDQMLKVIRDIEASEKLLSMLEGEEAVFLTGNLIQLLGRMASVLSKSGTEVVPTIISAPATHPKDLSDIADILVILLRHCSKFSEKASFGHSTYHQLFMWYRGPCQKLHQNVYTRLINQLSVLWSSEIAQLLFRDVLKFDSSDSQSIEDLTQTYTSLHTVCRLYVYLTDTVLTQSSIIWSKLSYIPNLVPKMLGVIETLGPKKQGYSFLLNASETTDFELEPFIPILQVFCRMTAIVFITVDQDDVYVRGYPFEISQLHGLAIFLNTICFKLYWHHSEHISKAKEFPLLVEVLDCCKPLLNTILDISWQRPLVADDPKAVWVIKQCAKKVFLDSLLQRDKRALLVLTNLPQAIPFKSRVQLFRDFTRADRSRFADGSLTISIKVNRDRLFEDGFRQLRKLTPSQLKQTIRVRFVNQFGLDEIGVDQSGVFKEFLEGLFKKVFSTDFGLFRSTSDGNVIPSLSSSIHEEHLELFEFIGRMLGKALHEGIVIDIPFALYIYAKLLDRHNFMNDLPSLDPELYRNLVFIKNYNGDCGDLGLDFTIDHNLFGKVTSVDIKPGGSHINLSMDNRFEYIHLMADFRLNQECKDQLCAFIGGFNAIIQSQWLQMFSPVELQWLMSGENAEFSVTDLRAYTRYDGGFYDLHGTIRNFWAVFADMSPQDKSALLKFTTSCSKYVDDGQRSSVTLNPLLTIGSFLGLGKDKNRLPTANTCFNLLKLPAYSKKSTLRSKLLYAIHAGAGFELA
ncbi:hypothetical protein BASA60_009292 [Batrachochytrium salamandrivorans]|nr:hypothetical protein BASA60_009292 [Batrachochytrium salamandrivorans]